MPPLSGNMAQMSMQDVADGMPATQTYHSADGTHAYTVDEYGRGMYWQLPPAPRLPTAAPRVWNYPTGGSVDPHSGFAPWSAAPQRAPITAQHHHEIESQLMLQHQLSKLQNTLPVHAPQHSLKSHSQTPFAHPGHSSRSLRSAGAPQYAWPNMPPSEASWASFPQEDIHPAPMAPAAEEIEHAAMMPYGPDNHNDWRHAAPFVPTACQQTSAPSYLENAYPQPYPVDQTGVGAPPHMPDSAEGWQQHISQATHRQQRYASQGHGLTSESQQDWPYEQWRPQQSQNAQSTFAAEYWRQQDAFGVRTGPEQPYHGPHQILPEPIAEKEPAPPSPQTLDRSAVPISNFGAEVIWHASSAFLDPELLLQAFKDGGESAQASPGGASSAASPIVMTPGFSPRTRMSPPHNPEVPSHQLSHLGLEQLTHDSRRYHERLDSPKSIRVPSALRTESGLRSPVRLTAQPYKHSAHRQEPTSDSSLESSGPNTPSPERGSERYHHSLFDRGFTHEAVKTPSASQFDIHLRGPLSTAAQPRHELPRTRSNDRSRDAVHSALRLVSPQWPWTTALDPLPTLLEVSRQSLQAGQRYRGAHADRIAGNSDSPGARSLSPRDGYNTSQASGDVSPAFRRFAHQVLAQTLLSPTAFLLAMLYALRVPMLAIDPSGVIDPEALDVFASPPSAAPFKLFTLGLMLANKHLDDNTFLNKTWHEVTGIPLVELNKMEQYYLIRSNFEIALPSSVWFSFLCRVKNREEARSAHAAFTPLHQSHGSDQSARKLSSSNGDETSRRLLFAIEEMLSAVEIQNPLQEQLHHRRLSHHQTLDPYLDECVRAGVHCGPRVDVRPTHTLHASHHQCQSAPAPSNSLRSIVRDNSCPPELYRLPPRDANLDRSLSDFGSKHMHQAPMAPSALLKLLNSGQSFARHLG